MLVIWIILILLLLLAIWLLIAPIRLNINSKRNEYLIKWTGIGRLVLIPDKEEWFFNLKIGFWKKRFYFSSLIQDFSGKKKIEPKKEKKKRKQSRFSNPLKKIRQILKSFDVKVCKINLDTDDYYWNALLIPVFQLVNRGSQHRVAINFESKNEVQLIVENRLAKLIYSFFK